MFPMESMFFPWNSMSFQWVTHGLFLDWSRSDVGRVPCRRSNHSKAAGTVTHRSYGWKSLTKKLPKNSVATELFKFSPDFVSKNTQKNPGIEN